MIGLGVWIGIANGQHQTKLSDKALLNRVESQTLKYFYDFAHPACGMAVERSDTHEYSNDVVTTGGTGFGIMGIVVGVNRGFIKRDVAVNHLLKITSFLDTCQRYHGAWSHWYFGSTGKTKPFSKFDNGGDLVETAYLVEGLLAARQYFRGNDRNEKLLVSKINKLWKSVEWNWYTNNKKLLYWHWSPEYQWAMNFPIKGWNECLITYVLAASSPTHPIDPSVYHQCWVKSDHFFNGKKYYNYRLAVGFPYGGPLFFAHYSFLGLDPRGLSDSYANYWELNRNHTLINYQYCIENPKKYKGYGPDCWGLTASDNYENYSAHSPTNDLGVITPTAALSSFPYTPVYSMKALRHFYYDLGDKIWGTYGFTDAFSESKDWYAGNYLAIDQGPIIVMIENYRSGLIWNLFMSCPEIQKGLKILGFSINEKQKQQIIRAWGQRNN
ncbi:MAG: glucoamylase family protein [Bacteroidota bacterium]|nr:glucoamylase family protein [Bacteroidota bacterium]